MSLRTLGDVAARSGRCITVSESATAAELSDSLARGGVDAVAVLSDGSRGLAGIATSRDIAKCIARGEDLTLTKVSQIMTSRPITLPPTESPTTALALMKEGRFRHLPIVSDEDSSVLGIVDVLHLAYDAINRLQVSYSMIPTRRGFDFMRAARETIEKPKLRPIVERSPVATLQGDKTVFEACETLVKEHLAAIVIVDEQGVLDGIFTCRDIVSRVIARGLDPTTTKLIEVMTKQPDCASPDYTILESLQRMEACGFRHLPVVENRTRVVIGLVDVLELASDALAGLQSVSERKNTSITTTRAPSRYTGKPAPTRGFTSFFSSLFSNTYVEQEYKPEDTPYTSKTVETHTIPPASERPVVISQHRRKPSYFGSQLNSTRDGGSVGPEVPLASFKFKDINSEYRRIKVPRMVKQGTFDQFAVDVRRRFSGATLIGAIKIKYVDEDGDEVLIANDEDLASCFEDFMGEKNKTIQLKVYEAERPPTSQIQSPISSNASSAIGSPSYNSRTDTEREGRPSGDTTSAMTTEDEFLSEDTGNRIGVPRTWSRQIAQTPSASKTAEGHQKMLENRIDEAIELFNEALKLDSKNARAQGGRGAARLFHGNSVGAEDDYRGAIALIEDGKGGKVGDLTFQMCIVGLVESLIDQRRYEEAVVIAGRMDLDTGNTGCIDAFRDELDSASNAAQEALDGGDFGDAMSCYTNALRVEAAYLKLTPSETARASLRLGRAKCYKFLEDYDMALEDYEAAVKLEPESVAGYKGCGKCLAELEQMERALEAYEKAQKLDLADEQVRIEIETIKKTMPDPLKEKKTEIAKLGAMLKGMNFAGKAPK